MRLFLVLVVVIVLAVGGGLFWFAGQAEKSPPASGEQRIEVDLNV